MTRIKQHPILEILQQVRTAFHWNGQAMFGQKDEMISSALIANHVHIFGRHPKDNSPQGIFCANGQCSQCLVIADGLPVKACMTPLREGMDITSVEGIPELPLLDRPSLGKPQPVMDIDVLIIGGGPAGLSAAAELGKAGIGTLLVDDKDRLGGKLVLQTHKFFGSVEDSHAGTRGFEIAAILADEVSRYASVQVWLNAMAAGVFSDHVVGVVKGRQYRMIRPKKLLVATGARERMLSFPGNTLPGVYGAGAFQTLVNRDLIKSSSRVLVVGGGNVGLIAAYHAIQAGIEVAALIEALPEVSGYKVHADKIVSMGVPIHKRHTVIAAHGKEIVESVTIAKLDENWNPLPGTEMTYDVDTVLIAVGLSEVNEFYLKAKEWGMDVSAAGDANEIAEASAAMFTGKIKGFSIAMSLGCALGDVPEEWEDKENILKSRPGPVLDEVCGLGEEGQFPVFHCYQEVPCNPCTSVCPTGAIHTEGDKITGIPFRDETITCNGCLNCVAICPGLAITFVDYRKDRQFPTVTLPYEMGRETIEVGQRIAVTDNSGVVLGHFPVHRIRVKKKHPRTLLVQVKIGRVLAKKATGIRVQKKPVDPALHYEQAATADEAIVCRCERVTAGELRSLIRSGIHDVNHLKAITRCCMGSCGSKTCRPMIQKLFRDEGIDASDITDRTDRPLFMEVPIGSFAGVFEGEDDEL